MIGIGRSVAVNGQNAESCEAYTGSIQRDLVTIRDIAVADAEGVLFCHTGTSERSTLQRSLNDLAAGDSPSLVVGNFTASPAGPVLPIGMAQRAAEGGVQGYTQLFVDMSELVRLVTAATSSLPESSSVVTDRNGTVLLTLPADAAQTGLPAPPYLDRLLRQDRPGTARLIFPDGTRRVVGYRPPTESVPVGAIFSLPEAQLMAPIDAAGLANSLIAVTGAVFAFVAAWLVGKSFIGRPIEKLDAVVAARRQGDRVARSGLAGDTSEFGRLSTSIDELFDELDRADELQRRTAEQRDRFAREVQHRVKNLLSIMQIVAKQTLSKAGALPEVVVFEKRIRAMIQANAGLLANTDYSGTMHDLIYATVVPFVGPASDRIALTGPQVQLQSKTAAALAMALHEMATNAVKYGSLGVPAGEVSISWSVDNERFELQWVESEGPPVAAEIEPGFGSMLISRVLQAQTGGTVTVEYLPQGFKLLLQAPFQNIGTKLGQIEPGDARSAEDSS